MKHLNRILGVLLSVFVFSLSAEQENGLRNKAIEELLNQLSVLERQHALAPTTKEKDALNEKQFLVYQELVRMGHIF